MDGVVSFVSLLQERRGSALGVLACRKRVLDNASLVRQNEKQREQSLRR